MYGDCRRVTSEALHGYTDGLATPGTIDHVLQIVRRWHVDMGQLRSMLPQLATRSVLLLWGDRDRAVGLASAQHLQSVLPLSQLRVVPGAGHLAFEEMPEICNHAMREWLASREQAAPSFAMSYSTEPLRRLEAIKP
jgi:pimeloyl-ACP methyl ester carboxylesterase